MLFYLHNLQITETSVSLQCVFHSIRFKVNKGWARRSPFFMSVRFLTSNFPIQAYISSFCIVILKNSILVSLFFYADT